MRIPLKVVKHKRQEKVNERVGRDLSKEKKKEQVLPAHSKQQQKRIREAARLASGIDKSTRSKAQDRGQKE